MSGYIAVWKDLLTKPAFKRLAKELAAREHRDLAFGTTLALGALAHLWLIGDSHIRGDDSLDMSPDEVEELLGVPGAMEVLDPNWATVLDSDEICLPGYTAHNNISAKKTAAATARQQRKRARDRTLDPVTPPVTYPRDTLSRPSVTGGVTSHPIPAHPSPSQPTTGNGGGATPPPLVLAAGRPDQSAEPKLHASLPTLAWTKWLEYRRKRKWPMDPVTLGIHLKLLSAHPPEMQTAIIERSIGSGWQGLFEPKGGAKPTHKAAPTTAELELLEASRGRG